MTQTEAPAVAAVSIAEAMEHCHVSDKAEESYVAALVAKATRYVERTWRRQLITATWELYLDAFPAEIELPLLPVQSVEAITYLDTSGTSQPLAAADYQVDLASPDVAARIKPAANENWPSTYTDAYAVVTVEFVAGYGDSPSDVPETIHHSILLLAAHWYRLREPAITGTIINEAPFALRHLMAIEEWAPYA